MRIQFVLGLAAAMALPVAAVDIAFKDASAGVVEMSGDGTGDVISRKSDAYRAKKLWGQTLRNTVFSMGTGPSEVGKTNNFRESC